MRCDLIEPHLTAYVDGELDEALTRAVEKHLEECRACRETVRDITVASAVVRKWKRAQPSASMVDTLRERTTAPGQKQKYTFATTRSIEAVTTGSRQWRIAVMAATLSAIASTRPPKMWP